MGRIMPERALPYVAAGVHCTPTMATEGFPSELTRGLAKLEQRAFRDGYMTAMAAMELAVYQGIEAVAELLRSTREEEDAAPIRRRGGGGWASNPDTEAR
jgi:hypothetical protein